MLVPKNAQKNDIVAMSDEKINLVRKMETEINKLPPERVETIHTFHAGVYARTIFIPAGMMITGALVKIETVLIASGSLVMLTDNGPFELLGYHILKADAGRKQAFIAEEDSCLTMLFATDAKTIEDAEHQFTDEFGLLLSNREQV